MVAFLITLDPWIYVGFVGQVFFFLRFFVQWLVSERVGQSVIPVSFWYFSLLGAIFLLIYSIKRHDPVFVTSFLLSSLIYVRNLFLISRGAKIGYTAGKL